MKAKGSTKSKGLADKVLTTIKLSTYSFGCIQLLRRCATVQSWVDFGENSRVGKLMSWHCNYSYAFLYFSYTSL